MRRKRYSALEAVDPEEVDNINECHKQNLLVTGYKPYRTESGKIKWLNPEQYSYYLIKHLKVHPLSKIFRMRNTAVNQRKVKHRTILLKFFKANIGFMMLVIAIMVILFVMYQNNFFI